MRGARVERPVEITETRIEERSLVEFIALVLRAREAPNTLDTGIPISHFSHFARSNSIDSHLVRLLILPLTLSPARYSADLAIALARCLSTSSLNTRLYRASQILNAD